MKLKNRYTGEVKDWDFGNWYQMILNPDNKQSYECSLTDFMDRVVKFREDWDEVERLKEFYYITSSGYLATGTEITRPICRYSEEIGNYFEDREEAEKAIEKLKAWKRLKDKGFKFISYGCYDTDGEKNPHISFSYPNFYDLFDDDEVVADLDLLFVEEGEDE